MVDEYYIGIYWKERIETLDSCIKKVSKTFEFLSHIDHSLKNWYKTSKPKKGDIVAPLILDFKGIEKLLIDGQSYNDLGELQVDSGYLIYLKSCKDFSKAHVLSISCGIYNKLLSNRVVLTLSKNEEFKHLTDKNVLETIYYEFCEIWQPDEGVIRCNDQELLSEKY